jgi:hypothetical protein
LVPKVDRDVVHRFHFWIPAVFFLDLDDDKPISFYDVAHHARFESGIFDLFHHLTARETPGPASCCRPSVWQQFVKLSPPRAL